MPFRKFFDRSARQAPAEPAAEVESNDEDDQSYEGDPDAAPEEVDTIDWRGRAAAVLPTGASTGSKRAAALYGADDAVGPTHFSGSVGCRVIDMDGNEYVDCGMALGSVALGYAE